MIRRMLRYIKICLFSVFFLFIMFILYFFFGGALCNDLKALGIERTFSDMALPDNTRLVETASFVGNTSGVGNLTEIWAGALVSSELSESELESYFTGYDIWAVPVDLTDQYPYPKDFIAFQSLNGENSGKVYFVISKYYDAFTQIDLRGH